MGPALPHQQSAQLYAFCRVEVQQSHGGAAFRGHAFYVPIFSQMKVFVPALPSRMKQGHNTVRTPGFRIVDAMLGPFLRLNTTQTTPEVISHGP